MQPLYSKLSRFQEIALYRSKQDIVLYLNGGLQFHSAFEAGIHERAVILPLVVTPQPRKVLILGGGLGLSARDALRFSNIEKVVVVELDPAIIEMATHQPSMATLNRNALRDERVELVIGDGFEYVRQTQEKFDLVLNEMDILHTAQSDAIDLESRLEFLKEEQKVLTETGFLSVYVPIDPDGAEFLQTTPAHVPEVFAGYVSRGFAQYFRLRHSAFFIGDHVLVCATTSRRPLKFEQALPEGCISLRPSVVRRLLRRNLNVVV